MSFVDRVTQVQPKTPDLTDRILTEIGCRLQEPNFLQNTKNPNLPPHLAYNYTPSTKSDISFSVDARGQNVEMTANIVFSLRDGQIHLAIKPRTIQEHVMLPGDTDAHNGNPTSHKKLREEGERAVQDALELLSSAVEKHYGTREADSFSTRFKFSPGAAPEIGNALIQEVQKRGKSNNGPDRL